MERELIIAENRITNEESPLVVTYHKDGVKVSIPLYDTTREAFLALKPIEYIRIIEHIGGPSEVADALAAKLRDGG